MRAAKSHYDAIVIGGGPGGSTTGAFLAQKGLHALVVEREVFPRFHTGESMLPGTWDLIWKLGLGDEIERCGQQKKVGARFNIYGNGEYLFGLARPILEYFPGNRGKFNAWIVLRSKFDEMLLENAARLGAEVVQPCAVEQVFFDGTRATGVALAFPDGGRQIVEANVVVDASGRDCLIARRLGLRHPDPKLNVISYFAHYEGAYHPGDVFVPIWIFTFEGGWLWYFSMMDNLTSVGVVVEPEFARTRHGRDLHTFFLETLAKVPRVREWVGNARPVTPVHAISAISYIVDKFAGDGWLAAGDAAGFLDPIFSAGIHLAMRSGEFASEAIVHAHEVGDFSEATLKPYDTRLREQMNVIYPMIYRWYDAVRNPTRAVQLFELATRFSWLARRVNATLTGAWDAVLHDPSLQFRTMVGRPSSTGEIELSPEPTPAPT